MPSYDLIFKQRAINCGLWQEIEEEKLQLYSEGKKYKSAMKLLIKAWYPRIKTKELEMGIAATTRVVPDEITVDAPRIKGDPRRDAEWLYTEIRSAALRRPKPLTGPPSYTALHLWERCKQDEKFRDDWVRKYMAVDEARKKRDDDQHKVDNGKTTKALLQTLLRETSDSEDVLQDGAEDAEGEPAIPAEAVGEGGEQPDVPTGPPGDVPA